MLVGFAVLKLERKVAMGHGSESKNEESRGVHIESMDGGLREAVWEHLSDAMGNGVDLFRATTGD